MKRKHKKHSKRKHSSSSSSSSKSSRSRSRSQSDSKSKNSSQKSKSKEKKQKQKQTQETLISEQIQEQSSSRPYKVNKFALGSMLFENRRTNDRMDKTEVQQANTKLKRIDNSGRESILLSAAINTVEQDIKREDFTIELIDGQYVRTYKPFKCGFVGCQMRFLNNDELMKHLKDHNREQTTKNNQRAQKFMENL